MVRMSESCDTVDENDEVKVDHSALSPPVADPGHVLLIGYADMEVDCIPSVI